MRTSPISRRRFLAISGAAALIPGQSVAHTWRGVALGADASIRLSGPDDRASAGLRAALDTLRRMERLFSLYDPASALSVLNRTGRLDMPPEFAALVATVQLVHDQSKGAFDPSIQALWQCYVDTGGRPTEAELAVARSFVGWHRVVHDAGRISLPAGMALSFNGIAQGFATDRVTSALNAHGFSDLVVNIGEYRVGTQPARLGVAGADGTVFHHHVLHKGAMATSSLSALRFADQTSHILSPDADGRPIHETVSVVADQAAIADGFSTALCLCADPAPIASAAGLRKVILRDHHGRVTAIES